MSYDAWKLASPEDYDGPDKPSDTDGVTCRGCNTFIFDASDENMHKHQGWFWCEECYYDLPEIVEGLQEAAFVDVARDDR